MKVEIKKIMQKLNDRDVSFNPIILSEEEYNECIQITEYFPFLITDKMIFRLSVDMVSKERVYKLIPISTYIGIVKKYYNISNNECTYLVRIHNGEEFEVTSEVLTSIGCKQLLKFGCIYIERQVKHLLDFLSESALIAPIEITHNKLGWIKVNKDLVFLSSEAVSNIEYNSQYIGTIDFKPKGNKKTYTLMLEKEVFANTPLTFVFILGFASIVLSFLNMHYDLGSLVFAISNNSSKGKSTAGMLCSSVYSNPLLNCGLMTSFCATNNALLSFATSCCAHTITLDEIATSEIHNMRKLLYQFCSGRDKMRLDTQSIMKETKKFDSVILTTAEFSIIDESAPNGIRARVFEIKSDLTTSAQNSNNIKKCVINNHALLGKVFSQYIINQSGNILADYEKTKNELIQGYSEEFGELTLRIIEKLAVILLTAHYVKKCFGFDYSIDDIREYIYKLEQQVKSESDCADTAYQYLMEYVIRNGYRFINESLPDIAISAEGRITKKGQFSEIAILKTIAEKELKNKGFENFKILQEEWRKKGILVEENGRTLKRVKFARNLQPQACYVFKIKNDESILKRNSKKYNISITSDDKLNIDF